MSLDCIVLNVGGTAQLKYRYNCRGQEEGSPMRPEVVRRMSEQYNHGPTKSKTW